MAEKICPKIFSQEKVEWKAPVSGHQMVVGGGISFDHFSAQ